MEMNPEEKSREADKIIRNHMVWSMGAGLIPVPIADFFAVSAIQLDMIRQMCKVYEIDFRENDGKAIISALTGSGLARLGAQAVKFIPGIGSVLGGVTMSVLSGASSYAIGEVFKKHFETGGTILDFDIDRLRKMYNEKFEKGKKIATDIRAEEETAKQQTAAPAEAATAPGASGDKLDRLKELVSLKEKGMINDAEYEQLKSDILNS